MSRPEALDVMSILAARPAAASPAPEDERERSVVAWNGSRSARSALAWAAARERRRGGSLTLVRVLEDSGGFRTRSEVQRALAELDAELSALSKAFPGLIVGGELRAGSAEDTLPALASGRALLVVGTRSVSGDVRRSPWSMGMRLLAGSRASIALVPTENWSWRSGVVALFRGAVDGAAVLFAAEEAQAKGMRLTLVAHEGTGPDARDEAELVAAAFPGLQLDVLLAGAVEPVLIGLARSASLVVTGADDSARRRPPLRVPLAAASEAPVAVIRGPRLQRAVAEPARATRSLF
jgi:hypothetical protein